MKYKTRNKKKCLSSGSPWLAYGTSIHGNSMPLQPYWLKHVLLFPLAQRRRLQKG